MRDTCHRLGWRFDRWQDGAGRLILSKGADGLYASDAVVMSIPRQVGKTYLVACIIFALCLIFPRLTVIWTAHRKTTAGETFASFQGMARRPKVAPHIAQVFRGKGEEQIQFTNGSRILFGARETGFGRGFTDVDILVFDEAQIMTEATLEDMGAAQNVAANPLTFFMGTPPRPKDPGETFAAMRQDAIDGDDEGTLYIEFSADRGTEPMDVEQLRKCNPSYPHRTTHRAMLRLRKKLKSDDSWNREARGIWDEVDKHAAVVSAGRWRDLAGPGPADGVRPSAFAVDKSHAGAISIAAAWIAPDGESVHAEEVWAGVDEDAAVRWLAEHAPRHVAIHIDNTSPAMSMVPGLLQRQRKVVEGTAVMMAKDCGALLAKCRSGKFSHGGQQAVTDAMKGGRKRPIGSAGGWGWDRRDESVDISPIVAVTKATGGALLVRPPSTGGRATRPRATRGRMARA
ncbi:terminase large subunit domain-containing protein [Nocardia thailandica]